MAVTVTDIVQRLDDLLQPQLFNDYCPNGLQIEGRAEVELLVTGVTACQALLDAAVAAGADAILVHHGYFWRGEDSCITGMKKRRIKHLLENNISLLAYHLPLDAHSELGNNAQFAEKLGINVTGGLDPKDAHSIGNIGHFKKRIRIQALLQQIEKRLGRSPLHIGDSLAEVETVAWCTGGAQGYIEQAINQAVDVFITGEISEQTVHMAREEDIHFIAAGHHATERYGVQAVGAYLEREMGVTHRFIDIDNPA